MEKGPKQKGGPGMAGRFGGCAGAVSSSGYPVDRRWGKGPREAAAPAMLTMPRLSAAASVDTEIGEQVIPGAWAVGIKLFSDGVLVVGLSPVETERGANTPGGLRLEGGRRDYPYQWGRGGHHRRNTGDGGTAAGRAADHSGGPGQRQLQLTTAPVANSQGNYQLGVWLRDSMAGHRNSDLL